MLGVKREPSTNPLRPRTGRVSAVRTVRGGGGPFTYILQGRTGWRQRDPFSEGTVGVQPTYKL